MNSLYRQHHTLKTIIIGKRNQIISILLYSLKNTTDCLEKGNLNLLIARNEKKKYSDKEVPQ